MSVNEWLNEHDDICVSINHPKTKAGWKTTLEMVDKKTGKFNVFRESIRYSKPSDGDICKLLDDMYVDFLNKRALG